jgi:hypothetical protein
MSLADPQSITIDAVTKSLPRTNVGNNSSEYTSADGLTKLTLSSAYGKRNRRVIRVDHSKVAADVFIPDTNALQSMSCYLVVDVPKVGFTNAEAFEVYEGFKAIITASSDAAITKLLGGES